jgi:hypothetical protein
MELEWSRFADLFTGISFHFWSAGVLFVSLSLSSGGTVLFYDDLSPGSNAKYAHH